MAITSPAEANTFAQSYVDQAEEYINRSTIHLERYLESEPKDEKEFAHYCAYGEAAVRKLDSALNATKDTASIVDITMSRLKVATKAYTTCGAYWDKSLGGKCEYDDQNEECKAKNYSFLIL